jgi:hypothetical protein
MKANVINSTQSVARISDTTFLNSPEFGMRTIPNIFENILYLDFLREKLYANS